MTAECRKSNSETRNPKQALRISRFGFRVWCFGFLCTIASCHTTPKEPCVEPPELCVKQYHAPGFAWPNVRRVVILPIYNESPYTRAGDELANALATELQEMGNFEVVAPKVGASDVRLAAAIHRAGQFNEAIMLDIGRATEADVVIHGTVTQYSPYPRPRMGLVFQAVSPREGVVISSVDGLWDTTRHPVEIRAKLYYRQLPGKHPWRADHVIAKDDGYADEMALESPRLFQRFVCHEAVGMLTADPAGLAAPPGH